MIQFSCKSDAFQILSRVFSLLIQCLRYVFETWLRKIADAPRHVSRWARTTEPEWPRACDILKRSTGLKNSVLKLQTSPGLLQIEESWATDLVQQKKKKRRKRKIFPEKPVWSQGKQDMTKDETSLGLISCKSWRRKLQSIFTWNLGHKLCLKCAPTQD